MIAAEAGHRQRLAFGEDHWANLYICSAIADRGNPRYARNAWYQSWSKRPGQIIESRLGERLDIGARLVDSTTSTH
jgi:hypothetical protein